MFFSRFSKLLLAFLFATLGTLAPLAAGAASGPLILYTFTEGQGSVVHDVSGNGSPLDLTIDNVGNTQWLPGGGLSIDRPALIAGMSSPDKIVDAVKATNAITIEAWVEPANTTQSGPARIATLSDGTRERNFTLGQRDSSYDVRLRTTGTSGNGTPSLSSSGGTLNAGLTHVVYTRNSSGRAKIFINGVKETRTTVSGDMANWSSRFSLALANETSGDRPWLGRIYRFAVYDRALGGAEVLASFESGLGRTLAAVEPADNTDIAAVLAPVQDGPLVLYTFDEGSGAVVHDRSGVGTPLDLRIDNTARTTWLPGGGLSVDAATSIKSADAEKIIDAVRASNAITIEAWVRPAKTTQGGPARIVSLSENTRLRNFTLGQVKSAYDVRLRSTETDNNGKPSLGSPSGTLSTSLTHVLYSRDKDGVATLYINGTRQSRRTVGGDFGNWDMNHGLALANEMTDDRPWLGEFYTVAIYDRAFSATDVDTNYALGARRAPLQDSTSGTAVDAPAVPADTVDSTDTATSGGSTGTTTSGDSSGSTTGSSTGSSTDPTADSGATGSAEPAPAAGTVTLNWSAPLERSDGAALKMAEIAGYTLYYGLSDGNYTSSLSIDDAYTTSATIANLPRDTYYFVITTRDTEGQESGYSDTLVRAVQ